MNLRIEELEKEIYDKYHQNSLALSDLGEILWWYLHKQAEAEVVMSSRPNESNYKKVLMYRNLFMAYLGAYSKIKKEGG